MMPVIARGFVSLRLSPDQLSAVALYEEKFPKGRYLIPCEISGRLKIFLSGIPDKKVLISEAKEKSMWECRMVFAKEKGIAQETSLGDHDLDLDWMVYVRKKYVEPLPSLEKNWET